MIDSGHENTIIGKSSAIELKLQEYKGSPLHILLLLHICKLSLYGQWGRRGSNQGKYEWR